jgi:hypothetical protein
MEEQHDAIFHLLYHGIEKHVITTDEISCQGSGDYIIF